MAQLRITKKFATDIKLKELNEPSIVTQKLDDWFIDSIRLNRKKFAMATHGGSKLTFFLPYSDIGGAKNVPSCIPVLMNELLNSIDCEQNTKDVDRIFNKNIVFCKTVNKSVLLHMRAIKRNLEDLVDKQMYLYGELDWEDITEQIHNCCLSFNRKDYYKPIELIKSILDPDNYKLRKY